MHVSIFVTVRVCCAVSREWLSGAKLPTPFSEMHKSLLSTASLLSHSPCHYHSAYCYLTRLLQYRLQVEAGDLELWGLYILIFPPALSFLSEGLGFKGVIGILLLSGWSMWGGGRVIFLKNQVLIPSFKHGKVVTSK